MLSFSVNANVSCDVPERVRKLIESNLNNYEERTHFLLEDIADLYLGIADPTKKKPVSENVAPVAYMKKCAWTAKVHKNKHESNINNSDEDDNEEKQRSGVSEKVLFYMEGHIDEIADSAEFRHNVEQLMDMVEVIELEQDVNIITAMLQAAKGSHTAINIIKRVKDCYVGLSDLLYSIMAQDGWTRAFVAA